MTANIDCLISILSHLSVRDRHICRRVNTSWKESSDHLLSAQKKLVLVSRYQSYRLKYEDSSDTIVWTSGYIKYNTYQVLISCFPNLTSLSFIGFDYWNDSLIKHMIDSCPALTCLEFIACDGFGKSRSDEYFYLNVTDNGWQRLVFAYGHQLTKLVIKDCDLDDKQLEIIVEGFRKLEYLDITGNHIRNCDPLSRICDTIRVIRLGPRLITGNNISIEQPLNALVVGSGRHIEQLYIQGFLTRQLSGISSFNRLKRLVVDYVKPLFNDHDMNFFSSIASIKCLECLELYEHNSHDGLLSLTAGQLRTLIQSCDRLQKLVISGDIWCDSVVCDSILGLLSQHTKRLRHLSLCPGNFETTDTGLQALAKLPALEVLSLTGFPSLTENGFVDLVRSCRTLTDCRIEDCFVITKKFFNSLIDVSKETPKRVISVNISDSRFTTEVPKELPNNLKISVNRQKDSKGKRQSSSLSDKPFFWKPLIGLVTCIGGLSAITITLMILLLDSFVATIRSKVNLWFIFSVLIALFIDLYSYHFSKTLLFNLFDLFI